MDLKHQTNFRLRLRCPISVASGFNVGLYVRLFDYCFLKVGPDHGFVKTPLHKGLRDGNDLALSTVTACGKMTLLAKMRALQVGISLLSSGMSFCV